jgi:argininosuccinate lyase
VGKAVKLCVERGCELQDVALADFQQINPAFDQGVYPSLKLEAVISIHEVEGGTAGKAVEKAIQRAEQRIAHLRGEVHAHA